MAKERWPRQQVRVVTSTSVRNRSFRRVRPQVSKKVRLSKKIHAVEVVIDLRNGCLTTLDLYLRQNRGLPDRQVAVELRKLISGSLSRSDYRLIVKSKRKGKAGAPRGHRPLTKQERKIAREVECRLQPGEHEAAWVEVASDERMSESTVRSISGRVTKVEAAEQERSAEAERARSRLEETRRLVEARLETARSAKSTKRS